MGRPKDANSRRSKAERKRAQRASEAAARLAQTGSPNERVLARREAFSFVRAEKGGSIDQDIHDAIGQFHVLGLLDGHGHEAKDLRDVGREYAELREDRYKALSVKVSAFERRSRSTGNPPPLTRDDVRLDKLDEALGRNTMERTAIFNLLTDYYGTERRAAWVQNLINYELAQRGIPNVLVNLYALGHDRYMLSRAIRGLCQLLDAGLPARFQRCAA